MVFPVRENRADVEDLANLNGRSTYGIQSIQKENGR